MVTQVCLCIKLVSTRNGWCCSLNFTSAWPRHKDVLTSTKWSRGHDILSRPHKLICHGHDKTSLSEPNMSPPQLPTLARQISNRSFKNKPKTSPIFFWWFIIINIIYYQLFITNKWACNILHWNHSFIWKAKTEAILQKSANCNKSGNKTRLQSPVSRIGLRDGKGEKHKSFKGEL